MIEFDPNENNTRIEIGTISGDTIRRVSYSMDYGFKNKFKVIRNVFNELETETKFVIGKFHFDYKNLCLENGASKKGLTKREADLLKHLCLNKEAVLKRTEILNRIWGDDDYFNGRSLDVFISKLRKYLKDDPTISIVNYHGVGFKLEESN